MDKVIITDYVPENAITYLPPSIAYTGYQHDLAKACEIAEYIESIELTEDNVQECKQMLATARKITTAIDDRRKEVKREILKPYKILEDQVKEINGIIDAADSKLRAQIREMEEAEREKKEEQLNEIWGKRVRLYSFSRYIPDAFDMWLEPRHLNKSVSMKSCESEMVEFMEMVEKDVQVILGMGNSEEVMAEYAGTLNLADSLSEIQRRQAYKDSVFEQDEETHIFQVKGKANIELTKKLLDENGIGYQFI